MKFTIKIIRTEIPFILTFLSFIINEKVILNGNLIPNLISKKIK